MARILIVDGFRTCSEELRGPLGAAGFEVCSVNTYHEAIRALNGTDQSFDFVILNIAGSPHRSLEWLRQTSEMRVRLGLHAGRVLCVATDLLDPQIESEIEACGGMVVYEQQIRSSAA